MRDNIKLFQKDNKFYFQYLTNKLYVVDNFPTYQQVLNNISKIEYYKHFLKYKKIARPYLKDKNDNYIINKNGYKISSEENKYLKNAHFYPMVLVFSMMINKNLLNKKELFIPNYEEFCEKFIQITCEKINDKLKFKKGFSDIENITFSIEELKYRLGYAYPSFIREFVAKVYWTENSTYFKNKYNLNDFHIGYNLYEDFGKAAIDVDIIINNNKYGICIYNDTDKGKTFKEIKDTERHKIDDKNRVYLGSQIIQRYNYKTERKISNITEKIGDMYIPKKENLTIFLCKVIEDVLKEKK